MSVFLLEDDVCLTGGRFGNLMVSNHDKVGCISMFFLFFVYVIVKCGFQRKLLLCNVRTTLNIGAVLRPRSVISFPLTVLRLVEGKSEGSV